MSQNYTLLPFDLYPGNYLVHVYDIEKDGKLSDGVNYPASTNQLMIGSTQLQPGEVVQLIWLL